MTNKNAYFGVEVYGIEPLEGWRMTINLLANLCESELKKMID